LTAREVRKLPYSFATPNRVASPQPARWEMGSVVRATCAVAKAMPAPPEPVEGGRVWISAN